MKTLDEKKKLAKFARGLGQPDLELEESIRREEELTARLFSESKKEPPIQILKEQLPLAPAPAVEVPKEEDLISQTMNALSNPKFSKPPMPDLQAAEIKAIRQQIADLVQRMGTLSWGGGGTGIVRIFDADDYDKTSGSDDRKFMTYRNGMFQMDFVNPNEIVANTAYVTSNTYVITKDDYYIGVNCASTVTLTLPTVPDVYTGREFYVKDESGNAGSPARWIDIYPSGTDKIDGQNYARLQIDWGGLKFIYRDGWRVI